MAIDVLNYPEVNEIARRIVLPESEKALGVFLGGNDQSMRLGDGFEIDGLHDYQPGVDEARHIDWAKSASRSDGGMWVRDHYQDRAPLTVLVSDIPSDRLARAYGEGDPLSTRALGFVASHLLLQANKWDGSPVLAVWSGGVDQEKALTSRVFEGGSAPRKAIEAGLQVAEVVSQQAEERKAAAEVRTGFLRRKQEVPVLPEAHLATVLDKAFFRAKRIASTARFVIISDFRDQPEDVFEVLARLRNNEVITVEVTNPHLRALPVRDAVVSSTAGRGIFVESNNMREEYKRQAVLRQAMISERLHARSSHTTSVDTSSVESLRNLVNLGQRNKR